MANLPTCSSSQPYYFYFWAVFWHWPIYFSNDKNPFRATISIFWSTADADRAWKKKPKQTWRTCGVCVPAPGRFIGAAAPCAVEPDRLTKKDHLCSAALRGRCTADPSAVELWDQNRKTFGCLAKKHLNCFVGGCIGSSTSCWLGIRFEHAITTTKWHAQYFCHNRIIKVRN